MEFLNSSTQYPQQLSLILGFFDGVHAGHQNVVKNTTNNKKILITFTNSPAEYFQKDFSYIYSREFNYSLLRDLGIDYVYEQNFSNIAKMSAEEYLTMLINKFNPVSITTGFNHTFGAMRRGNPDFLKSHQASYKYYCTPPTKIENTVVSSTAIKKFLANGDFNSASKFLTRNFSIESTVIKGIQLGRKLGFPTANLKYPENIVKIPYGVYKIKVFDKPAILNWGIKPTFEERKEILEIHIPNFASNLYNQTIRFEILSKIRDEQKFKDINELKLQIEKDIEECLK